MWAFQRLCTQGFQPLRLCTQGFQLQVYHKNEPILLVNTSVRCTIYTNHEEYIVEKGSRCGDAAAETLQPETSQWFADLCLLTPLLHHSSMRTTSLAHTLELTFADFMQCLNDSSFSIVYEHRTAYLSKLRGPSKYLHFFLDNKHEVAHSWLSDGSNNNTFSSIQRWGCNIIKMRSQNSQQHRLKCRHCKILCIAPFSSLWFPLSLQSLHFHHQQNAVLCSASNFSWSQKVMRARANSASAPLTLWAIRVGGIFKTPPSGSLLLALSLATASPLIQDLGGHSCWTWAFLWPRFLHLLILRLIVKINWFKYSSDNGRGLRETDTEQLMKSFDSAQCLLWHQSIKSCVIFVGNQKFSAGDWLN